MKEMIRCKSCGFIVEKGRLHGKCPACGVPDKMFEPYVEKISPFRKFVLSLDAHPVLVHFPQAFAATTLVLSLLAMIIDGALRDKICATILVLGFALPFTVLLAFLAGLMDGMIRFRRLTPPLLVTKMIFGSAFFLLSVTLFSFVALHPAPGRQSLLAVSVLSAASVGCASYLGKIGTSLLNSKFPG
jgi:uncharacterized membrane protein/rubredoxin